jgi:hypothetical protein
VELVTMVELGAVALAGWAAWLTIPRPVERDWERLFKVTLSALTWGEAEAAGGTEAERTARWSADLAAHTPFHPAGRAGELKLGAPDPEALPTPALDGERALVERLVALSTPAERWRAMYVDDTRAVEALGEDPTLLGPAYSPERLIGAGVSWEAIAAWSDAVPAALARRLALVRIAVVTGSLSAESAESAEVNSSELGGVVEALVPALGDAAPAVEVHRVLSGASPGGAALVDSLLGLCDTPARRLAVVLCGAQVVELLQALVASPVLRDRVLAVISVGGPIARSPEDAAWLAEHFTHARLEPELQRTTAFFAVTDADPAAPLAWPWAPQRFPVVPVEDGARETLSSIDLGPLPVRLQPPLRLARALLVVLAAWV